MWVIDCARCHRRWVRGPVRQGELLTCPACGRDPEFVAELDHVPRGVMYVYDERRVASPVSGCIIGV
jgi:hypothetical protein